MKKFSLKSFFKRFRFRNGKPVKDKPVKEETKIQEEIKADVIQEEKPPVNGLINFKKRKIQK